MGEGEGTAKPNTAYIRQVDGIFRIVFDPLIKHVDYLRFTEGDVTIEAITPVPGKVSKRAISISALQLIQSTGGEQEALENLRSRAANIGYDAEIISPDPE